MNYFYATPSCPPVIRAAGGLLRRTNQSGEIELLIVHRPKYHDWSLPKGKLKRGESWKSAARREVEEETGITPVFDGLAGVMTYPVQLSYKVVYYWKMKVDRIAPFSPKNEIDKILWVDKDRCLQTLTYPSEINFIHQAQIF